MYAQQWSTHLYLKAMQKVEKNKKLTKENHEKTIEKEMEGCTFKPKTNHRKQRNNSMEDTVEKTKRYKERSLIVHEQTLQEEKENCTFRPKITKIDKIMKTFKEKTKYDRSSQKYFQRVNKARNLQKEKNQKMNPNYNQIYDKLFNKGHHRSITMTLTTEKDEYCTFNPNMSNLMDYSTYKRTLHEHLHTITVGDESTNYSFRDNKRHKSVD